MTPLAEQILGRAGRSIWVLQAGVALVLLIACANVANLLLARAESRQREFAVPDRARRRPGCAILRKALTESLLLALAGARSRWSSRGPAYRRSYARIPTACLASRTSGSTRVCCCVRCRRGGLRAPLRTRAHAGHTRGHHRECAEVRRRGSSGATRHHVRSGLVMAETALTVIVAVGAGLLLRTVHNLTAVDPGFHESTC